VQKLLCISHGEKEVKHHFHMGKRPKGQLTSEEKGEFTIVFRVCVRAIFSDQEHS